MRIEKVSVENVQAIKVVSVAPDRTFQIVSGANGNGKSSLLHAIQYAFAGKRSRPPFPVRDGEGKGTVVVEAGDWRIELQLKGGTSSLRVTQRDTGQEVRAPQETLNALLGDLTFDPLAFSGRSAKEQRATLIDLVELEIDLDEHEEARRKLFDERTAVNRRVRDLTGDLRENHPPGESFEGLPTEAIEITELSAKMAEASTDMATTTIEHERLERLCDLASEWEGRVADLQRDLAAAKAESLRKRAAASEQRASVADLVYPDIDDLQRQIDEADSINGRIRQRAARANTEREHANEQSVADGITLRLAEMDREKVDALKRVNWPIDGLGIHDDYVTFNGRPFEQSSASERLKCSIAIGMAVNPELRVMFIENGSLLDDESMAKLREIAEAHDYQIWVERVSEHAEPGAIHIVDGSVANAEAAVEPVHV